jgi:hypothetical protein
MGNGRIEAQNGATRPIRVVSGGTDAGMAGGRAGRLRDPNACKTSESMEGMTPAQAL